MDAAKCPRNVSCSLVSYISCITEEFQVSEKSWAPVSPHLVMSLSLEVGQDMVLFWNWPVKVLDGPPQ